MGWSGGTALVSRFWHKARKHVAEKDRVKVLAMLIDTCQGHDWDCENEIDDGTWPETKKALAKCGVTSEDDES
jgi:hypothetical protein